MLTSGSPVCETVSIQGTAFPCVFLAAGVAGRSACHVCVPSFTTPPLPSALLPVGPLYSCIVRSIVTGEASPGADKDIVPGAELFVNPHTFDCAVVHTTGSKSRLNRGDTTRASRSLCGLVGNQLMSSYNKCGLVYLALVVTPYGQRSSTRTMAHLFCQPMMIWRATRQGRGPLYTLEASWVQGGCGNQLLNKKRSGSLGARTAHGIAAVLRRGKAQVQWAAPALPPPVSVLAAAAFSSPCTAPPPAPVLAAAAFSSRRRPCSQQVRSAALSPPPPAPVLAVARAAVLAPALRAPVLAAGRAAVPEHVLPAAMPEVARTENTKKKKLPTASLRLPLLKPYKSTQ
jgi:hypothetical protein